MGKRDKGTQRDVLIEAVRTSGEPVKAIAAQMGVKQATAYYWMKKARAARVPQFARVVPRSGEAKASMVIEAGGAIIRLESGFDAELLLEVIAALRGQRA
jgi:transposase-like protein